jgi:iron complex transport system ATP-binding protein
LLGYISGGEEKMLEVKNIFAGYGTAKDNNDIIHSINFKVQKGESLCILGPNGSGKSTLLKAIARIINYRGLVTLNNIDIVSLSRKELAKKIALLGQTSQMFFPYTVYETVSMGRYAWSQGFMKNLSAEDISIIDNTLKQLDIWNIKDHIIDELSGGTLQRVFLAKTLAQTPELILLDEPANHLDLKHQLELLRFIKSWVKENNKIAIGVFHDLNLARLFGNKAVVLNNGNIAASGTTTEVMNNDTLQEVYGIDVRSFMLEALERWQ